MASFALIHEATSALEANLENEINKAPDAGGGKVTVIQKAHRLNTVQQSDRVFLVEPGRITGPGIFSELLQKSETVPGLAKLMAIEPAD